MNLSDFAAFIFDLDGTLLDSGKYHAQAFAHAVLNQSGYTLTTGEHHEFFASHSKPFAAVLNDRHGLSLEPEKVLAEKRIYMDEIFVAELFEGAREFMEHWHGKKPMALATNSPIDFVHHALKEAELASFFHSITTSDEVEHRKPATDIFEVALRKLDVSPSEALVFEDQLIGVEAARAAGVKVVAVDNGQPVAFPAEIPILNWKALLKR